MRWVQTCPTSWVLRVEDSRWVNKANIVHGATMQIRGRGRKWWRRGRSVRVNYWAWYFDESASGTAERNATFNSLYKAKQYIGTLARLEQ